MGAPAYFVRGSFDQNGSASEARVSERIFLPSSVVTVMLGNKCRDAAWACGTKPTSNGCKPGANCVKPLASDRSGGSAENTNFTVGRGSLTLMLVKSLGNAFNASVSLASAFHVANSPFDRRI